FLDPIWHLSSFQGDDPNNPTGWKNAEYDRIVDELSTMPSGPKRLAKIRRAQRILVAEDAIVIPLFYSLTQYVVSPRLKGLRANPLNVVRFEELSLRE